MFRSTRFTCLKEGEPRVLGYIIAQTNRPQTLSSYIWNLSSRMLKSGILRGHKEGNLWMVDVESVRDRANNPRPGGRPRRTKPKSVSSNAGESAHSVREA